MKLRQYIILLLTFVIGCMQAPAQDGSSAYSFLDIPMSTRIYGLGGVNITLIDDDITTIDQNPALLGPEMSGMLAMSYMKYVAGSNFAGARYAHSSGERGAWSAAVQYFGYGSMTETDETGTILGEFSPKDAVFMGAYSHDITDRLRGGANLKLAYSSYAEYSAMAIGVDLGINYYDPDRDLSLSAVVSNLGGQVKKFNEKYDRLPIDVRLGWSQTFGTLPLRFSVTAWNLTKWRLPYYQYSDGTSGSGQGQIKDKFMSNLMRHLVFGVDLVSSPNWHIGVGYNYKTRTDMLADQRTMLSGLSLTGGIRVKAFSVGLAFSQRSTGASTFMLNLSCSLSELL
ncbi:MAG: type IX secretion system protein PorQ [Clostridium sp.]|nr:type IX secretion system protein PorQ [Clostridium sp.]